jgi:hypothetical protein
MSSKNLCEEYFRELDMASSPLMIVKITVEKLQLAVNINYFDVGRYKK